MKAENLIENVVLTPSAVEKWHRVCAMAIKAFVEAGAIKSESDIGTEEMYAQPNGTLRIQCKAGAHSIALVVGAGQWSYAN